MEIKYQPSRKHANPDAFFRSSAPPADLDEDGTIRQVTTDSSGEMAEQQHADPKLNSNNQYTEQEVLPTDKKLAEKLVLERPHFTVRTTHRKICWSVCS